MIYILLLKKVKIVNFNLGNMRESFYEENK